MILLLLESFSSILQWADKTYVYAERLSALIPTLPPIKGSTFRFERRYVLLRFERRYVLLRFERISLRFKCAPILSFFVKKKGECNSAFTFPLSLTRYEW